MEITVEVEGGEKYIRAFAGTMARAANMEVLWRIWVQMLMKEEVRVFNTEGAEKRFVPLSPRYKAWKDAHYPGKPIMQLTGRLKGSLTGIKIQNWADMILNINDKGFEFGSRVPYAHKHQTGSGKMPRRKTLQLTGRLKAAWAKAAHRHYKELLEDNDYLEDYKKEFGSVF